MRLVIYGINYRPELTGIGKYSGEMVEWLAARGHEVRVVTAPPYYPQWKVENGYSVWRYQQEELNGTRVFRCPLWVPKQQSGLKRLLHLFSFAITSFPVALWLSISWRPDVVWVVEPPLFCAPQAWLFAKLSKARSWLHIQDFEVDAAFDLGLLPSGKIRSVVIALERLLMRRFDFVSTISERMLERLTAAKGVEESKSILFPNWVDTETIYPMSAPNLMREELNISLDTVVALYSGNMGEKQGLDILIESAKTLADEKILFLFCGDGAARQRLYRIAEGLPNIRFLALQPVHRLNELLNLADIHLLPQRADVADLVMPSKLTGMLASGRPIVATAHPGTQVAQMVENCGIVVPPGDSEALSDAVIELSENFEKRSQLGLAARKFAIENLSKEKIMKQFEKSLLTIGSDGKHSL